MPELPEVEHARGLLARRLARATRERVVAKRSRVLRGRSPADFARALEGLRIAAVERRGKWLRITTDGDVRLFAHLGMTGKWVARDASAPPERFEKVRLVTLRRRTRAAIVYVDPRMFGAVTLAEDDVPAWRALGPDPLVDGVDLTRVAKVRRSIKEALLDQTRIAGIGNIQATEALWRARIDPRAPAASLSRAQLGALKRSIEASLRFTIAQQGDGDAIAYVEEAGAPNPFRVYGRAGEPCPRCETRLARIVQGGRGTALCPRCQHVEET